MQIDRIEKDPHYDDIITVIALDGSQIKYRLDDGGVLRPGRIWQGMTPPGQHPSYTVTVFIPLPDGRPEILKVTAYS